MVREVMRGASAGVSNQGGDVDVDGVEVVKVEGPTPDSCAAVSKCSQRHIRQQEGGLTKCDDKANSIRQGKPEAEALELGLDSRITVNHDRRQRQPLSEQRCNAKVSTSMSMSPKPTCESVGGRVTRREGGFA